jgi:TetR/AcrR family transcriptional repressor of nem operon
MSLNRKAQIVSLSSDLLRTKGFDGFSYLDLSRQLGITKASIHHHFPKKEDLGIALCEWAAEWLQQGLTYFDDNSSTHWEKLARYLKAAEKHTLKEHKMCPISAFHSDLANLPEAIIASLKKLDDLELNWITRVVEQGVDSGEFKFTDDCRSTASLFLFTCKGALHYSRLHGAEHYHRTMGHLECFIKK